MAGREKTRTLKRKSKKSVVSEDGERKAEWARELDIYSRGGGSESESLI